MASWVSFIFESQETLQAVDGGVHAVWERRNGLGKGWSVAKKSQTAGEVGSSEGVREVEKGSVKGVEGDERSFEGDGSPVGVDLGEADE